MRAHRGGVFSWGRGWLAAFLALLGVTLAAGAGGRPVRVDDLFAVVVPYDLALSPDGAELLYTLKRCNVGANRYEYSLWRVRTDGRTPPRPVFDWAASAGYAAAWSPDGRQITYVRAVAGRSQLWSLPTAGGEPVQLTKVPEGIRTYAWSPDGRKIALLVNNPAPADAAKPDDRPRGQVVTSHTNVYMLLGNQTFLSLARTADLHCLFPDSGELRRVTAGVQVNGFQWAPDSEQLVFTGGPQTPSGSLVQEVGVQRVKVTGAPPELVLQSGDPRGPGEQFAYSALAWSPDGRRLLFVRRSMGEGLAGSAVLGWCDLATGERRIVTNEDDFYPVGATYRWTQGESLRVQNIVRGDGHLYDLDLASGRATLVGDPAFSDSEFAFASGGRVAFVRQTQQSPPQICLADEAGGPARTLVDPNAGLREVAWPRSERITWRSADGTSVEGWYYPPEGPSPGSKPPLLVVVHGGPSFAVGNNFQPFASLSRGGEPNLGTWPYPFWLYPQAGYAVLVPNYRGTRGYGEAFARPKEIWGEPVDDVVSGVDFLVASGRVDPARVGLLGHSHGCQLGAHVISRHRRFAAASLAEIDVNEISRYGQLGEWLVMRNGEYYYGGPPYTRLEAYVAASPLFHLAGLATPTLLEYGARSQAVGGLEFRRALSRNGVPHEMIVYPGTGHNFANPALERESLERNLDWFDYWLRGKKDPAPDKAEQYARWERNAAEMAAMRREHPLP